MVWFGVQWILKSKVLLLKSAFHICQHLQIEVLSQLHHPNIVLLLGACPESGCLVYEYLENGSLEDYISPRSRKSPLPWFIRFRIVFEIACGLAFLHNSKPEPIVHRDLKPGNILLDKNFVSKIGDVGLAKLMSDVVPDHITEYRDSILAGTLFYMDPEYQRTGTLRPKSDLYAFGVIVLQLLTGRHPNGLLLTVENAIANNSFSDIFDKSVSDWPVIETEQLARLALSCSNLRCRDRPELEAEVLPALKRIINAVNAGVQAEKNKMHAPSQYYCPIIQVKKVACHLRVCLKIAYKLNIDADFCSSFLLSYNHERNLLVTCPGFIAKGSPMRKSVKRMECRGIRKEEISSI